MLSLFADNPTYYAERIDVGRLSRQPGKACCISIASNW